MLGALHQTEMSSNDIHLKYSNSLKAVHSFYIYTYPLDVYILGASRP